MRTNILNCARPGVLRWVSGAHSKDPDPRSACPDQVDGVHSNVTLFRLLWKDSSESVRFNQKRRESIEEPPGKNRGLVRFDAMSCNCFGCHMVGRAEEEECFDEVRRAVPAPHREQARASLAKSAKIRFSWQCERASQSFYEMGGPKLELYTSWLELVETLDTARRYLDMPCYTLNV